MTSPLDRTKKHDHRQSIWVIAGGYLLWCYRCGAWKINDPTMPWHRPTGMNGKNPAIARPIDRAKT